MMASNIWPGTINKCGPRARLIARRRPPAPAARLGPAAQVHDAGPNRRANRSMMMMIEPHDGCSRRRARLFLPFAQTRNRAPANDDAANSPARDDTQPERMKMMVITMMMVWLCMVRPCKAKP
jgi:hypothetical protein